MTPGASGGASRGAGRTASQAPGAWLRRRVRVGEWTVTELWDGTFRLDGGAMWGVVPRALWERMTPPGPDNTIPMALRCFLAERGDDRVVIEVGIGDRWSEKERRIYGIAPSVDLQSALRACGLAPEDVTHVVASHCHWDHIGAITCEHEGELRPRFPRARHFAPLSEVEMAKKPDHARRGSYRAEDVTVIEAGGLLETFSGDAELFDGLHVHHVGGHSDGVSLVTLGLDAPGATAVFWSDVVPTTHHIQPPYIMAYDIDVVSSFENRSIWLERAAAEDWLGLFYHDEEHAFARLKKDGRRYAATPLGGELRSPV